MYKLIVSVAAFLIICFGALMIYKSSQGLSHGPQRVIVDDVELMIPARLATTRTREDAKTIFGYSAIQGFVTVSSKMGEEDLLAKYRLTGFEFFQRAFNPSQERPLDAVLAKEYFSGWDTIEEKKIIRQGPCILFKFRGCAEDKGHQTHLEIFLYLEKRHIASIFFIKEKEPLFSRAEEARIIKSLLVHR